jgi:hypothetical protein
MKSAMEMAVLTSIQHPNIVRVFACLTDLVEEAGRMLLGHVHAHVHVAAVDHNWRHRAKPVSCRVLLLLTWQATLMLLLHINGGVGGCIQCMLCD